MGWIDKIKNFKTKKLDEINSQEPKVGRWFCKDSNRYEYARVVAEAEKYSDIKLRTISDIESIKNHSIRRNYKDEIVDYREVVYASTGVSTEEFKRKYIRIKDKEIVAELEKRYQDTLKEYGERIEAFKKILTPDEVRAKERLDEFLGKTPKASISNPLQVVEPPATKTMVITNIGKETIEDRIIKNLALKSNLADSLKLADTTAQTSKQISALAAITQEFNESMKNISLPVSRTELKVENKLEVKPKEQEFERELKLSLEQEKSVEKVEKRLDEIE